MIILQQNIRKTLYLVYLFDISRHFFVSDSQYEKVTYIMLCLICSTSFLHCFHCSILVKNFDRNCHLNTNITILNYVCDSFLRCLLLKHLLKCDFAPFLYRDEDYIRRFFPHRPHQFCNSIVKYLLFAIYI